MKIIDKRNKKDYYDYLVGIYGIDEKLILDRRDSDELKFPPEFIRFYIAGYIVEGLYIDDKFYYGEDLKKFKTSKNSRYSPSRHNHKDISNSIQVLEGWNTEYVYLEPMIDPNNINTKIGCPILLILGEDYYKFLLLKKFDINKFIPAETIYQWLSAWLGVQISLKEQSPELSNDGKIEAKGFDKKRSFRTKMK